MRTKFRVYFLILIGILTITINSCKKDDAPPITVTDYDGNVYHTIAIGTQLWMVENLKVTHYQNGNPIPNITDNYQWGNLMTGAYCSYNNDINNVNVYGLLYNWYAATDIRNICPKGWHVPSDTDWVTLENYLGGNLVAGNKMKETGTLHWISPNASATNVSGFTGLPGGFRSYFGSELLGVYGFWWSSTDIFETNARGRVLVEFEDDYQNYSSPKEDGYSIRCVWNK